jgi:hypothetical protein
MQPERAVLRVAVETARRIAYGDAWAETFLDGLIHTIGIDCGAGITAWRPSGQGPGDLTLILRGAPPLTPVEAAAAVPLAGQHPLMGLLLSGGSYTTARVSDLVSNMPQFWDSAVYHAIHGVTEGRFPASVSFGTPGGTVIFAGAQRHDREFSNEDLRLMDVVRGTCHRSPRLPGSTRSGARPP